MATDSSKLDYLPWRAPEVDDSRHLRPVDVEAARKLAWEQGYEDGYSIGMEAGMRDAGQRIAHLDEILESLARPFADLDDSVASQLAVLVKSVAEQIVRREISIDPTHIVDIVREGLQAMPVAQTEVTIVVNPEDASLIEAQLADASVGRSWHLKIDGNQPRGGCALLSDLSQIDAQIETRLQRLLSGMIDAEHAHGND
jgi:flagellar assembly protein FliH